MIRSMFSASRITSLGVFSRWRFPCAPCSCYVVRLIWAHKGRGQRVAEQTSGEWLTMTEAAALLGVHRNTVRNRCKAGRYQYRKVATPQGEEYLVARADLVAGHRPGGRTRAHIDQGAQGAQGAQSPHVDASPSEPVEASYRVVGEAASGVALVPLATMVEELRGLADQLADLARRNEGLALEVGTLRERQAGQAAQLMAKDETIGTQREALATHAERVAEQQAAIAELRRRAEAAEAELSSRDEKEAEAAALFRRRIEQERRNRAGMQDAQDGAGAPGGAGADDPSPAPSPGFWTRVRQLFGGSVTR